MPTVSNATPPKLQFLSAAGVPLVGGKLYSYAAGTSTPLATYTDNTGNVANANPVILDSRGEASVWLAASQYKLVLTDANDVQVWSVDGLNAPDTATLAALAANGGSALIGYLPAGTGAAARTVQAKLRDSVSVKDFGATGDGATDDTTALQNALTYCTTNGAELFFPKGSYRTTAKLTIDRSGNTLDPTQGALYGISLRGSSPASAQILADHDDICLEVLGGAGAGWHTYFYIDGIEFTKKDKDRAAGSVGLKIDQAAYLQIQRFDTSYFEYGIYGVDVLAGTIMDGTIRLNNYGFKFERGTRSYPNAITMRGIITLNNQIYGGAVYGPNEFNYIGGTIESNGYTGILADPNSWGLYVEQGGIEGSVGAHLSGVYIENNNGIADLWFVQTGATVSTQVMHTISGCSFLRFSNTRYVTQNILTNNGVGNNSIYTISGCGFKDISPYVSSAARLFIASGNCQVIDGGGNFFCDDAGNFVGVDVAVFAPIGVHHQITFAGLPSASRNRNGIAYCSDGGGGTTRPSLAVSNGTRWWQIVLGSFAGAVGSTGTAQTLPRGWTSSKTATGVYVITHNLNITATEYAVVASPKGTAGTGFCSGMVLSTNSFEIYFANTSGVATDMAFCFTMNVI